MKIKLKRNNSKKYTATVKDILSGFKIKSPEETIEKIVNEGCSITRYGDGEFDMICGTGMNYQKYDEELAKKLEEVLNSSEDKLLVGINNIIDLEFKLLKLLSKNKQYYSSNISRFYIDYKDKGFVKEYVRKLRQIWNKKDIIIVEGEQSRLGVGNDLFNNAASIQRIICPSENAFACYGSILAEVKKVKKDRLILLALGPTATVLAYDLYKAGYIAIDIGHVDIEYEWFLRKATEKIRIENKYVTEVKDGRSNIIDIKDEKYYKEIIAKIH